MKKGIIILSFLFAFALSAQAQQIPHFTQYMFNGIVQNPAHINRTDYAQASLLYRYQWTALKGAPQTAAFMFNYPMAREKMEIGAVVLHQSIGITNRSQARINLVYRTPLDRTKKSILAFGANAGMVNYSINGYENLTDDVNTDNALLNAQGSTLLPDLGFGVSYRNENIIMGLASTHLMPSPFKDDNVSLTPHYYANMSYFYRMHRGLTIVPSGLVKYVVGAIPEIDLNTNFIFNNQYWLGASYRTGDAFSILAGVLIPDKSGREHKIYRIGYAYDLSLNRLIRHNYGSHELMLTILFRTGNPVKCATDKPYIINNDRFHY